MSYTIHSLCPVCKHQRNAPEHTKDCSKKLKEIHKGVKVKDRRKANANQLAEYIDNFLKGNLK